MTKQSGFTLIELMIVVAILGVLSAAVVPVFKYYQERTERATSCKQGLLQVAVEMDMYKGVNQTYPPAGLLSGVNFPAVNGDYTYYIDLGGSGNMATSYKLRCQPAAGVDTDCGALTYDNFGRMDAPAAVAPNNAESCWR